MINITKRIISRQRGKKQLYLTIALSAVLGACQTSHVSNKPVKQTAVNYDLDQSAPLKLGQFQLHSEVDDVNQVLLLHTAKKYLGTPYVYGGNSETGLDCSSLIQSSYAPLGIKVPRTANDQFLASEKTKTAKPGDLLFFDIKNNGEVSHVGMYVGDDQMIHASLSRKEIIVTSVNKSYWKQRIVGVGRFL